ncbi:MAG: hypothetical protein HYU70_09200 [Bacteroidetes bacterium]|nr:hypothetical protein [Bacteroidota bacterium]
MKILIVTFLVLGINSCVNAQSDIVLNSGYRVVYDHLYDVHGYTRYDYSGLPEAALLRYGYYGHRFATRQGLSLVIRGDNNYIGIGTSTPAQRLDINGGVQISADPGLVLANSSNGYLGSGTVYNYITRSSGLGSGYPWNAGGTMVLQSESLGGTSGFAFATGASPSIKMAILGNGNVGIGTAAPSEKLTVSGNVSANALYSATNIEGQQVRLFTGNGGSKLRFTSNNYGFAFEQPNDATLFRLTRSDNTTNVLQSWDGIGNTFISGNLGIGSESASEKLSVNGNIKAKKLIITPTGWSDYVFDQDYKLRSLSSLEAFIKENKHLPEVPSANEVAEKGISVGDSQALLLKKIEELTLYILNQQKQIDELTAIIKSIRK